MKGYLLDTPALLWLGLQSSTLRPAAREALLRGRRYASVMRIAEIAIKAALGKLTLPSPIRLDFQAAVCTLLDESLTELLPLDLPTVVRLRHLPLYHRDPFDRMINAQALDRGLAVATRDRAFGAYAGLYILDV